MLNAIYFEIIKIALEMQRLYVFCSVKLVRKENMQIDFTNVMLIMLLVGENDRFKCFTFSKINL